MPRAGGTPLMFTHLGMYTDADQHLMGKVPVRDQLTAQETDWNGPQLLQYCWKNMGHSKRKEQLGAVIPQHS